MKIVRLRRDDIMQKGDIVENKKAKFKMTVGLLAGQPVNILPETTRVFRLWPHGDERTFYKGEPNVVRMDTRIDQCPMQA